MSAGTGTLVHDLIEAAGLGNFDDRRGWRSIPLERLAYEAPDVYAVPSFGATNHENAWTPFRHPVATERVAAGPSLGIDGATTACGGWFLADAVEALAAGAGTPGASREPAPRPVLDEPAGVAYAPATQSWLDAREVRCETDAALATVSRYEIRTTATAR